MPRSYATVLMLAAFVSTDALADQEAEHKVSSLHRAVASFNSEAQANPTGRTQPPLTEAEVIAAIRGWIPAKTPGVTDDVYARYQEISETRFLPETAKLKYTTRWTGYRGYRIEVWWIDLQIQLDPKKNSRYSFRIRDQKLSSRKLTPGELAERQSRHPHDPHPDDSSKP